MREENDLEIRFFMHYSVHVVLTGVALWLSFVFFGKDFEISDFKAFALMAKIGDQQIWASLLCSAGVFGLITMFVKNWLVRVISAAFLSVVHSVIAILFFLGDPNAPGSGLFLGFGLLGICLAYSSAHVWRRAALRLAHSRAERSLAR